MCVCVCVFGMAQKKGRRMFRNTHATAQTFGEPLKILSKLGMMHSRVREAHIQLAAMYKQTLIKFAKKGGKRKMIKSIASTTTINS